MKLKQNKKNEIKLEELPDAMTLSRVLGEVKYRERYLKPLKNTLFTLVTVAAVAVIMAMIWFPVLQIYGNSMTPSLSSGDTVVAIHTKNVSKGDMIAFYYNNKVLVKRVIATSGQWVNIDKDGTVRVDNKKIDETYLLKGEEAFGETNIELPYQVPDGKLFVMGDHRRISVDSRNTAVGTVSDEQLVGKLALRIWPLSRVKALN